MERLNEVKVDVICFLPLLTNAVAQSLMAARWVRHDLPLVKLFSYITCAQTRVPEGPM